MNQIELSNQEILHNLLIYENDLESILGICCYLSRDKINVNLYLKATRERWFNKTMTRTQWLELREARYLINHF